MAASLADRTKQLNNRPEAPGKSIVYVMSRDQRAHDNHALLAAQAEALRRKLPLAVVFCLYPATGYRSREHYDYMLSGLAHVERDLQAYNIPFISVIGKPKYVIPTVVRRFEAAAVYVDFNPLRGPQRLASHLAQTLDVPVYCVDTHNIVPCWVASPKQEVGARTLRPKIHALLPEYLHEPPKLQQHPHAWPGTFMELAGLQHHVSDTLALLPKNGIAYNLPTASEALRDFLHRAGDYESDRNDPVKDAQSQLSPYIHFGQLSSLRIVLELLQQVSTEKAAAFIEEIVVRKELSDNYCYYNHDYDRLSGAPAWAQKTLELHAQDLREFNYSLLQLERAQTHDPAWNAAQRQLTTTGKIHGYMRMYWAKKVLEWSPVVARAEPLDADHPYSPILLQSLSTESGASWAMTVLIFLNDFYSIDGGDPNGYAGIAWSLGGVHDRPWAERPIFGMIRYMNYNGLRRKFAITEYEHRWNGVKNS